MNTQMKAVEPSSSSSLSPPTSTAADYITLRQAYSQWTKFRRLSIALFQDLVNAKNKLSHIKQQKLVSLGFMTSSSKVSLQVYDEISDLIRALDEVQNSMIVEVATITNMQGCLASSFPCDWPVDESFLVELLQQVKNQTALEASILNRLRNLTHGGEKDQDLSITLMACLTYPPYLRKSDMRLLLDLDT